MVETGLALAERALVMTSEELQELAENDFNHLRYLGMSPAEMAEYQIYLHALLMLNSKQNDTVKATLDCYSQVLLEYLEARQS